jgi:peptide/nickel transport system substrate-binding protein
MGPIQRSPRVKLVSARASAIFFVNFNLLNVPANRPLMNVQVRQAVQYAVNRTLLNQTIMHGTSKIVATFCPPESPDCDPSIVPYPYDPARARAMLQAAGYPNGFDMTLAYTNGAYPGDGDIALAIADQLGHVGVRVKPELMDYGVFLSQFPGKKHAQDALLVRVTAQNGYFDDIALEEFTTGGVASYWNNAQFDQVLAAASLTLDPSLRTALLRHAQQLVKDNAPAISLFTAPNADAMNAQLNWTPRPDALLTMSSAHW